MKRIAIVSYNIYCNFTNYGSALQTYALHNAINKINGVESIVLDYCPDILIDKDVLNPFKNMWDKDEESRRMCELTLPAIRINNDKFNNFYRKQYNLSSQRYTSENFNDSCQKEKLDGFVCGSDTIFCIDEFGFDNGYYANFEVMKQRSVSYAASFGDSHFNEESYKILNKRLLNFKALALRENDMISYVKKHVLCPVQKVVDPTLLLEADEYEKILAPRQSIEKYLLVYARRYNSTMETYAEEMAKRNGWKIIEISLRATNASKHEMRYDAGVEEFLSLVKGAECVITNSFHGMIFAVQFRRPFYIFSREQCNTKIDEILRLFAIEGRELVTGKEGMASDIDYAAVHHRISDARKESIDFLRRELVEIL